MNESEDVIYLAGYFDADGSFQMRPNHRQYRISMCATGVDSEFMSRIAMKLVGICGFNVSWSMTPKSGKCKDAYCVRIDKIDAVLTLCSKLLPYLVLKKERASILLTAGNYMKQTRPDARDTSYLESLYVRLDALNKRGRDE